MKNFFLVVAFLAAFGLANATPANKPAKVAPVVTFQVPGFVRHFSATTTVGTTVEELFVSLQAKRKVTFAVERFAYGDLLTQVGTARWDSEDPANGFNHTTILDAKGNLMLQDISPRPGMATAHHAFFLTLGASKEVSRGSNGHLVLVVKKPLDTINVEHLAQAGFGSVRLNGEPFVPQSIADEAKHDAGLQAQLNTLKEEKATPFIGVVYLDWDTMQP